MGQIDVNHQKQKGISNSQKDIGKKGDDVNHQKKKGISNRTSALPLSSGM